MSKSRCSAAGAFDRVGGIAGHVVPFNRCPKEAVTRYCRLSLVYRQSQQEAREFLQRIQLNAPHRTNSLFISDASRKVRNFDMHVYGLTSDLWRPELQEVPRLVLFSLCAALLGLERQAQGSAPHCWARVR